MTIHVRRQLRARNLTFYNKRHSFMSCPLANWVLIHHTTSVVSIRKVICHSRKLCTISIPRFHGWSDVRVSIQFFLRRLTTDQYHQRQMKPYMHHKITKHVIEWFYSPIMMMSLLSGHCGRNNSPWEDMSLHLNTWFQANKS
jgi:hypothetical protein